MDTRWREYVEQRRQELWALLGDLPWDHQSKPAQLIKVEDRGGYLLEHLVLDLNGQEPVPAYLLLPKHRPSKAPALLYLHSHGAQYTRAKQELYLGCKSMLPYADTLAGLGIVTLCIDSWCFGERQSQNGQLGEMDTFKRMLWMGQVLWGMMVFDDLRSLDYLATRPEVDPSRIAVYGMSMGATRAWWLAALDERVKMCIDLCCLTDFEELLRTKHLRGHSIYYYVPKLLQHFQCAQINELIVPRKHLSLNGRHDLLTPPAGVEKIRDHLLPLYRRLGVESDCAIEIGDHAHEETPEARAKICQWLSEL